jgi:hypothetical protein
MKNTKWKVTRLTLLCLYAIGNNIAIRTSKVWITNDSIISQANLEKNYDSRNSPGSNILCSFRLKANLWISSPHPVGISKKLLAKLSQRLIQHHTKRACKRKLNRMHSESLAPRLLPVWFRWSTPVPSAAVVRVPSQDSARGICCEGDTW